MWTINRLRKIDPDVLAVVVSGYSNAPVLADYESHGFHGMLPKPFLLEDLERVVGQLMEKKQSQQPSKSTDEHIF